VCALYVYECLCISCVTPWLWENSNLIAYSLTAVAILNTLHLLMLYLEKNKITRFSNIYQTMLLFTFVNNPACDDDI
jgi:hypothetical protein